MNDPQAPIRAVLFDLGGVLLDIDFGRALAAWERHTRLPAPEMRALFSFDEAFRRHETGHLDDDAYFAYLRERLELDCGLDAVRAGFDAILLGEIGETVDLLQALRGRVPRYAISNTNPSHVAEMERAFPGFLQRFDAVFTSHRIGHRKPQPEAFAHVLEAIGVPARETLLFDDLPANVDAARALGLQAVQVRGPRDVRAALAAAGLLSARAPAAAPRS